MTARYVEHRFYSTELDATAARVSVADARGDEYFAIVEAGHGAGYRERRDTALDTIERAIRYGWPAGLVTIIPAG